MILLSLIYFESFNGIILIVLYLFSIRYLNKRFKYKYDGE